MSQPTKQMVTATSLDLVRIECVGEGRAVTAPGAVWVEFRDAHERMRAALQRVLDYCDHGTLSDRKDVLRQVQEALGGTTDFQGGS